MRKFEHTKFIGIPESVEDMLRQSNEIQEEIRKLSSLCDEASSPTSRKSVPGNVESEKKFWKDIKLLMAKHELPPIPGKIPTFAALTEAFINILTEFSSLKVNFKEMHDKAIVPNPFEKPPISKQHRKATSLASISSEAAKIEKVCILDEIKKLLGAKDYSQIVPDLKKIKQVMLTLPEIENFMNCVCKEILPNLKNPNYLQQALIKIKKLSNMQKEFEFVLQDNVQMKSAIDYFSRLFDVQGRENLIGTMDGIFYFVHEMKEFLDVIFN